MLLSQIIATMPSTVKCEMNNLPFTIEDILRIEFNWNMYEITPPWPELFVGGVSCFKLSRDSE